MTTVSLSRIYKQEADWKTSDSFGRDDLLLVAKVADLAHTWIFEQARKAEPTEEGAHA